MKIVRNRRGQGLIEYLILVALVAVSSIAVMRVVGNSVNVQFSKVAKALGATVDGDLSKPKVAASAYKKRDLSNFLQGAVGNTESRESAE
ncbi:MAG: class III signal peptide-containing protein [Bdellovibrionaceae bacterium]|nr:class III signal peptide-containing protein [Pseudobdellovibrionaceae bacterium]